MLLFRHGSSDVESRLKTGWDVLAGDVDFVFDHESSRLEISAYKHHFPMAVQTAFDCLSTPKGDKDDIVAKARLIEYWKMRKDNITTGDRVADLWLSQCFGDSGLGTHVHGRLSDLESLNIDVLNTVRSTAFSAENTVLAVSGPAEPDRFLSLLEGSFGKVKPGVTQTRPRLQAKFDGNRFYEDLDSMKARGIVAFEGVPWTHELLPTFTVLREALGMDFWANNKTALSLRKDLKAKFPQIEKYRCLNAVFTDSASFAFDFSAEASGQWRDTLAFAQFLLTQLPSLPDSSLEVAKLAVKMRIADVHSDAETRLRHYAKSYIAMGKAADYREETGWIDSVSRSTVETAVKQLLRQTPAIVLLGPHVSRLDKHI